MNAKIKKSAITALSVGLVAGLTLGVAQPANAAGEDIVFIQGVKGDGFYITMDCGIQAAAKKAGAKVTTVGPAKFDATLQKPILDSIVAKGPRCNPDCAERRECNAEASRECCQEGHQDCARRHNGEEPEVCCIGNFFE